ncbi:pyridoxamine 5'-phosphate oxidase family protein [Arthrobacter bambusae]|uniref:pyridoxamine 5'-phosphate oxidase family protein n=1 Tax=Arthrobacter bambusae TaxID=1338426 RepID=UPI0027857059|nr:pyridoxamine 5'-phosphate oxidase family protein [Arthrobacter bambusae]MDQ0028668.1 nitroimidazol reductase NimA-like FMN-containing flavoprotein (pyridoxamine 5'-phosphate oxidase superfamily) [Arthrobacter bambusae]MDQ0096538.1 nitroimidazol reductase NimA-like FMN-containing flavoprotein (pyridoxamine 5'-phosphate oxidase superfamily) [Arthrobacter bambusae]
MENSESRPDTEELSVHDCWKYLRSSSVARVAVVNGDSPEIFPINYVPDEGTVVFRTGPGTKLGAVLAGRMIALEADGFNTYGTIAWSVIVKGHAEIVSVDEELQAFSSMELSPWEPGAKDHLIRVTPTELTGRRFVISPPSRWWPPRDS